VAKAAADRLFRDVCISAKIFNSVHFSAMDQSAHRVGIYGFALLLFLDTGRKSRSLLLLLLFLFYI